MQKNEKRVSPLGKIGSISGIVLSVIYLINPTAGLFELIPDALPVIGNIDEVFFAYLIFSCIQYLRTGEFVLHKK